MLTTKCSAVGSGRMLAGGSARQTRGIPGRGTAASATCAPSAARSRNRDRGRRDVGAGEGRLLDECELLAHWAELFPGHRPTDPASDVLTLGVSDALVQHPPRWCASGCVLESGSVLRPGTGNEEEGPGDVTVNGKRRLRDRLTVDGLRPSTGDDVASRAGGCLRRLRAIESVEGECGSKLAVARPGPGSESQSRSESQSCSQSPSPSSG
jgi:hypothetical protein